MLIRQYLVRAQISENAVSLIVLALDSLVDAAAVFPTVIKSDLYACIFHTFTTILGSGACQENLVPQALPILRRFLTDLVKTPQHDTLSQLRSALATFLTILKTAQRREVFASLLCEKNTLLASTILLTSSATLFSAQDPILESFVDELMECLNNTSTTKVSAGLSRSLLLLPFQLSKADKKADISAPAMISSLLLPRLLDFLINLSDDPVEGSEETRPLISQVLTSFAVASPSMTQKRVAYGVVMPALLQRANIEGKEVWLEISARLMELAARDQAVFRAVLGRLDAESKTLVQEVLRAGDFGDDKNNAAKEDEETVKEPTIALRFDF